MWLEHQDLRDIVTSAWTSVTHVNTATCLAFKLREILKALAMWSKTQFESVKRKKLQLLDVLNKLDNFIELRFSTGSECSTIDRFLIGGAQLSTATSGCL